MSGAAFPPARPFSWQTRRENLAGLDRELFDVAVIGGGITGAGTARDAALRGYRVLLVEQGDFASGTSSASSRLIHGGLRYLAHGHMSLVFEALSERRIMRRLAPHLVRPLDFLFPVYSGDPYGLTKLQIGVGLYDVLSLLSAERYHRNLSPAAMLELEASLARDDLEGGLAYYDCQVDDARLTLENALDAHELGAVVLSYARLEFREALDGGRQRLRLTDVVTGRSFEAAARTVINATGPWCETLVPAGTGPLIRPTRGVHLVFGAERLPVRQAVVMQSRRDGRILFAIPWGTHSYVGTTETEDVTDPARVTVTPEDVAYLLETTNRYFPAQRLTAADVVSTWAGLRPLIHVDDASPTSATREHRVIETGPGFFTIAGGKLTTYRRMARDVVDRAAAHLKRSGVPGSPSRTDERLLPGARDYPAANEEEDEIERIARSHQIGADSARHLLLSHGSRCAGVLAIVAHDPRRSARIVEDLPYIWAEWDYALAAGMVIRPADFLMRRTAIFHKAADGGRAALKEMLTAPRESGIGPDGATGEPPAFGDDVLDEYEKAIETSRGRSIR